MKNLKQMIILAFLPFMLISCQKTPKVSEHIESEKLDYFSKKVKPILDARCVACHSCYNSPCQLNLTSYEGVLRGASLDDPYAFPLINAKPPTRLGVDAKTTEEWRKKGFFSVLPDSYERSLLAKVIDVKRDEDYKDHEFKAEESRTCPDTQAGFNNHAYLKFHNMPYGLPKLDAEEIKVIQAWISSGHPGPDKNFLQKITGKYKEKIEQQMTKWEELLNHKDFKNRLSARYFYEHTFLAHLYFEETDTQFFRLIRAENRQGPPIELATTRPYDAVSKKFYYRFQKITETLVSKTHIVFPLSEKRFESFKQEFIESKWTTNKEEFPAYGKEGANPFTTFMPIPRMARYRFFLNNARYFIRSFMKGPVCRGQTALNVINDHFWLMFLDPSFDLTTKDEAYFNTHAKLMTPPAELEDRIKLVTKLRTNRWKANQVKMNRYAEKKIKFSEKALWTGFEEKNKNALLTIYRHFDSSDVLWGAKGVTPKTIWVMDYQIFEDVYYNLVAGYNLFGPILHQLNTRLYMDLSRISSEDLFLTFLDPKVRESERNKWSQEFKPKKKRLAVKFVSDVLGEGAKEEMNKKFSYQGSKIANSKTYASKESLLNELLKNHFSDSTFSKNEELPSELKELSGKNYYFIRYFPDVAYLRLKTAEGYKAYSLIRNKFHYNVNMLFFEDQRQNPDLDTIDILPEYGASYPNFYFDIDEKDLQVFRKLITQKNLSKEEFLKIMAKYGVSRHSTKFWEVHDWFNKDYKKQKPVEGALLDLNRYINF